MTKMRLQYKIAYFDSAIHSTVTTPLNFTVHFTVYSTVPFPVHFTVHFTVQNFLYINSIVERISHQCDLRHGRKIKQKNKNCFETVSK